MFSLDRLDHLLHKHLYWKFFGCFVASLDSFLAVICRHVRTVAGSLLEAQSVYLQASVSAVGTLVPLPTLRHFNGAGILALQNQELGQAFFTNHSLPLTYTGASITLSKPLPEEESGAAQATVIFSGRTNEPHPCRRRDALANLAARGTPAPSRLTPARAGKTMCTRTLNWICGPVARREFWGTVGTVARKGLCGKFQIRRKRSWPSWHFVLHLGQLLSRGE